VEVGPGTIVSERYKLVRLLGQGGMGYVWEASHLVTGKAVALKFLTQGAKIEARKRFLREARAASRVEHPNVVSVHDVLTLDDGALVMVMDRLIGETLGEHLERHGHLGVPQTADILLRVVSGVGTAHAAGVVHRDLKPDNIFLTTDPPDVRVLDFGVAKLAEEHTGDLTTTGSLLGTPYYMAPEQVFGERDVDARADVWALGIILYECLCGQRPFEGENAGQILKAIIRSQPTPLIELAPGTPDDLCDLVKYMIAPDRAERMTDLREAHAVLRRFATIRAPSFESARSPMLSIPPSDSNPSIRSGNRSYRSVKSGAFSDSIEDADTERAATGDGRLDDDARPRRSGLDTTDALEKPTWARPSSGRKGWLVAGAAAAAFAAVVIWQTRPAPTQAPEPTASPASRGHEEQPSTPSAASAPSAAVTEAPTTQPTASASASSRPSAHGSRHVTDGSETASPKSPPPEGTSLPHGIDDKVPF
jgi:eukaryotic-like serine/threonine-protein kinase